MRFVVLAAAMVVSQTVEVSAFVIAMMLYGGAALSFAASIKLPQRSARRPRQRLAIPPQHRLRPVVFASPNQP